jgi:hypothetical protein
VTSISGKLYCLQWRQCHNAYNLKRMYCLRDLSLHRRYVYTSKIPQSPSVPPCFRQTARRRETTGNTKDVPLWETSKPIYFPITSSERKALRSW